jgi:hypothetical protein
MIVPEVCVVENGHLLSAAGAIVIIHINSQVLMRHHPGALAQDVICC